MIKGTYIFYQDGKELYRSPNIITKFGKRYFTKALAGNIQNTAKDMAFGISSSLDVSNVSGDGTTVTFTTSTPHGYSAGNKISAVNITPESYNISNVTIENVLSPTQFTVLNSAMGTYVSDQSVFAYGNIVSDVDTRLGFEVYRTPVILGSTDIQIINDETTYAIIYKATIPQDVSGLIYEVGLYPSTRSSINNYDSKFIADFDKYFDWSDSNGYSPTLSSIGSRFGGNTLTMQSETSSSIEYKSNIALDLSGYSNKDSISLAYYKNDSYLDSITLKFYSSDTDYYSVVVTPESGVGYKITDKIFMSEVFANVTGNPVATSINKIGIVITPTSTHATSVNMDAVRINDEDTFDPIFGLLSRSILSYPYLIKQAGKQIDVEYRLDLGF